MNWYKKRSIVILSVIVLILVYFLIDFFDLENIKFVFAKNNRLSANMLTVIDLKDSKKVITNEIVVKFKESEINLKTVDGKKESNIIIKSENLIKKDDIEENNVSILQTGKGTSLQEKINDLKDNSSVEFVQPNFKYKFFETPDDTSFGNQWALHNTGQNVNGVSGTADADMDAIGAWDIESATWGDKVVAVIDSGVDYDHPDLVSNMVAGWDFIDNDATPMDDDGHGTHIAGIIAAESNNSQGISGLSEKNNLKIMPLRFDLTTEQAVEAINYAKNNNVKIINASWGAWDWTCSGLFDRVLWEAIRGYPGLFVTAAGNYGRQNGNGFYVIPSDYGYTTSCWTGLDNVLSIAATDQNDVLASFSDWGVNFVDIAAPGKNILSTYWDDTYEYMQGTSMASPYAAALGGLIFSRNPNLDYSRIKNIILNTGDNKAGLSGKVTTGKRINAQTALSSIDTTKPTGSIKINNGYNFTRTGKILLNLSASDAGGVYKMRFSNNGSSWTSWMTYKTSSNWSLISLYGASTAQGTKTVYAQFLDNSLNRSIVYADNVIYDYIAPVGSLNINGRSTTTSTLVTLYTHAVGTYAPARYMRFSNNGKKWTAWQSYRRSVLGWRITSSNYGGTSKKGVKYVYVQYKDPASNVSSIIMDSIILK
jgi:subtilisin family serine protease